MCSSDLQGAAGSSDGPCAHHRDRNGVLPFSSNGGREEKEESPRIASKAKLSCLSGLTERTVKVVPVELLATPGCLLIKRSLIAIHSDTNGHSYGLLRRAMNDHSGQSSTYVPCRAASLQTNSPLPVLAVLRI